MTKLNEGGALESETSEKPALLRYEVFQNGDLIKNTDLGELPQDVSDPESWKRIIQICKDKEIDVVCFLDKPYRSSPYVVFKRNGEYLFFAEYMLDQAIKFAKSDWVMSSTVLVWEDFFDVYYVKMFVEKSFILYNRSKLRFCEAMEFGGALNCQDAFFHEDIAYLDDSEADHYVDAYEEATEMIDEILYGYFRI